MLDALAVLGQSEASLGLASIFAATKSYVLIFAGFSLVIFVHELGHFFAAKVCKVRVDKFAIGFGRELFGFTRGETRYAFNFLPLGGYVKMLGQEDFALDKEGEWRVKEDPRSFTHKPVGQRMFIVSAGVIANLIFAAAMFAAVFMLGVPSIPAEIGQLQAGMPAEQAGLRVGDRIVQVNNQTITDQADLQAAIVLSNPDERLTIVYERKDPTTGELKRDTVSISPEMSPDANVLRIGVAPPSTNEVAYVLNDAKLPADQQLQVGDRIVAINGEPTQSYYRISDTLADLKGEWATLTVERPVGAEKDVKGPSPETRPVETKRFQVRWRARQLLLSTGKADEQSGHLLGLVPRQRVRQVTEGQRADTAGIKIGDIIARWGGQIAPRMDEIVASRRENPERDIRVTVYRPGEGDKNLVLRPKVTGFFSSGNPVDGLILGSQENDQLIVADIMADVTDRIKSPAAVLKDVMPRGSLITKVNEEPVQTWNDLARQFVKLAGNKVKLTWSFQGQPDQSGELYVPHTLGTTFPLPGARQIVSINGITRKEADVGGKRVALSADNWLGASEILRDCVGKDVPVVFKDNLENGTRTAIVHVTPEMVDTWLMRVVFVVDDMITWHRTMVVRETNPLKASLIGLRKTAYFIEQVYRTMQRTIFTRSMSVDQISGPVGILQVGSQVAAAGLPQLIYFLALISANLAVINFLPLPIMDGGVFVFLLIEKIKGSPLSMKIQAATQLIGLALIIGIFLFVTFQDIQKLAG